MPRVRRRPRRRRNRWDDQHVMYLERGYSFFAGEGFRRNPDPELIKSAWADLGSDIMARWIVEHPGTRPWAWWQFDAPEPRKEDETEAACLQRRGLLTKAESDALLVRAPAG